MVWLVNINFIEYNTIGIDLILVFRLGECALKNHIRNRNKLSQEYRSLLEWIVLFMGELWT